MRIGLLTVRRLLTIRRFLTIRLLAGSLLSGAAALCHSQEFKAAANDAVKHWEWPAQQRSGWNQLPQGWHVDLSLPLAMPGQVLSPRSRVWSRDPSIDAGCILHPPQAALGAFSQGTAVMQDRYPGLMWMPVGKAEEKTEAKVEDLPTQWPGLKIDAIPSTWPHSNWPKLKLDGVSVEGLLLSQPSL